MKLTQKLCAFVSLVALLFASSTFAADEIETQASLSRFKASHQTQPFFNSAYGYVVFPSVGKGGFWVGGAYGTGTVFQNHNVTGHAKLYQISVGLTFGGQTYSEIIFFQDKRAYERFISGSFELDAQASAVALTEGAQAKAGTEGVSASSGYEHIDMKYTNGIAVFTYTKGGLMLEASLAGQKFEFEALNQPINHVTTPPAVVEEEPTVVMGNLEPIE